MVNRNLNAELNSAEQNNDELWVAERLRALDPENDWTPNATGAFARLHGKQQRRADTRRRWIWASAAAAIAGIALIALPSPATCAIAGVACPRVQVPVLPAPAVAVARKATASQNYKVSGSPSAPIVIEIYSDYECPACGDFYRNVFPRLEAQYVKTGKVRIVHRDLPLSQHPYAIRAARYADAAGELGFFDPVFRGLFASQALWSATGDVDSAVAKIVPRDQMLKIRKLVENDPAIDATLTSDMELVHRDGINQTPTLILISNGVRKQVAGSPPFDVLVRFLDEMLKP